MIIEPVSGNRKWMQVLLHVLAWLVVFSIPYLFRNHYNENRPANPDELRFIMLNTLTGLFWVMLFYFNANLLVPRLLYTKKYLLYGAVAAGVFALILAIHLGMFRALIETRKPNVWLSTGFNLPTFVLTMAVSTAYKFLLDRSRMEKLLLEKQDENLKTELSFLRSQISPHFIFNVLNNMVALVRMKSDQLEPTIMKLSGLMQYMLYDTDEEKVFISDEIGYLRNYIDLQQQRFGSKVRMDVLLEEPQRNYQIEPMLLIPFVENAFKHGVGLIENPSIYIHLREEAGGIEFEVRNAFNPQKEEVKDRTSGIGLQNVARRLNLLYPGKHSLLVNRADGIFDVRLKLKLT